MDDQLVKIIREQARKLTHRYPLPAWYETDDLVQDIWEQFIKHPEYFPTHAPGEFAAYCYQTGKNIIWGRLWKRSFQAVSQTTSLNALEDATPEFAFGQSYPGAEQLLCAICSYRPKTRPRRLSVTTRRRVHELHGEGYKVAAIARALGINERSVRRVIRGCRY